MKSNKKMAFTLMEMLVVIVIIGIILAIVFSSATSFLNDRSKKLYNVHMDVVDTATNNYIDQYKGQLSNSDSSCFNIDYNTLIVDSLVKEADIKCKGNIIISKISNSFQKDYYLSCVDQNEQSVKVSDKIPSGCRGFNGKFKMEYTIYEDSNKEKDYDGNNYVKDAYVFFTSISPYSAAIDYYEYSLTLDGNWAKISSGSNLGTINNIKDFVGTFHVRSVDKDGNKSTSVEIPVKMDNTGPDFNTNVSGTYLTKTISISNVSDKGVKTIPELAYSFDGGVTWQKEMTKSVIENNTFKVCTKDTLENVSCKEVKVEGIDRVTPEPPIIAASDSKASGSWHSSDFTLNFSGANNISGNTYYYGTTTNPTTTGTSTLINKSTNGTTYYVKVCSGAGLCSGISSYQVKLDKEVPSAPVITGGSSSWSATAKTISVSTEAAALSGISHYQYCVSTSTSSCNGTWTNLQSGTKSVSINTNGTRYIYFRGISTVGKIGISSAYQTTKIDTSNPIIIVSVSGKVATFTIKDNVGTVGYGVNQSETSQPSYTSYITTNGTVTWTASAAGTYQVWVKDNAGRTGRAQFTIASSAFCSYAIGKTWDYGYTGGVQAFTVPCSGTYKLEVWGAQGGSDSAGVVLGGKGGYATGILSLSNQSQLYVVVGGQGGKGLNDITQVNKGGYNGGGAGGENAGGGGGASHIGNFNSTLAQHGTISGLYIVAGGGGGSDYESGWECGNPVIGGYGGGATGGNGQSNCWTRVGSGGTQVEAGTNYGDVAAGFGQGGGASQFYTGGGGGGGLYGGGASDYSNGSNSGAGGSGYIGGVSGGSMQNGVREGNGYARITLTSINN